jgi:hypothetical protein
MEDDLGIADSFDAIVIGTGTVSATPEDTL